MNLTSHWLYLGLNILTISIPLLRSFEPKVRFASKFKFLLPAILAPGTLFIIWDVLFTRMGVWGFNDDYLLGIQILNLPLEEYLFFITIPYACVFTYEALKYFVKKDLLIHQENSISVVLILGLFVVGILHLDKWYTSVTFISTSAVIFMLKYVLKVEFLSRFYFTYAVILVPFFFINGILTGTGIPDQVVWYNDAENLGIRIGTIPLEDSVYGMLLILLNVFLYEFLQKNTAQTTR